MVSTQYQVQFGDFFKNTRWKEYIPRSERQLKARLIKPHPNNTPDLDADVMTKKSHQTQAQPKGNSNNQRRGNI